MKPVLVMDPDFGTSSDSADADDRAEYEEDVDCPSDASDGAIATTEVE